MNGIEDVISRPDLGDRAIFLTLAPIVEADRRSEAELWREFEVARPRILGALLDAVVHGLARISHTIFARSSKVERGFVSFCVDVLARGVGRRERELGFFRSCGCSEQFDLSVGLG